MRHAQRQGELSGATGQVFTIIGVNENDQAVGTPVEDFIQA